MVRDKTKKDKIISAYPDVTFFSEIFIGGKEIKMVIGGFTFDGGIRLESPYELVKKESKSLGGKDVTYYNIVKSVEKMSQREKDLRKILRKREADEKKYNEERKKEIKKELKRLENKKWNVVDVKK